ncbi:MAG: ammonium transporter [Candidatus Brocadiales bacterium]
MGKVAYLGVSSFFALLMFTLFGPEAMAEEALPVDTGDNAWMLCSSALVLIMTPGVAFLYGGIAREKDATNALWMSFIVICIVSVAWVLWAYSLAFAPGGNFFIGNLEWAALGIGAVGQEPSDIYASTIPHLTFMIFQAMFAIITVALASGSTVGRLKFTAWLLFIPLWLSAVYSPVAHWVWGSNGWLGSGLGAMDFAGGTVVHITSGTAALILCLFLGRRREVKPPHHAGYYLIGTTFLWFGWFGFNAGSEVAADGLAASAFVVTNTATGAAGFTWFVCEWAHHGKGTLLGACSGAVAGLVAITPASGFVGPMSSIAIGVGAGLVCYYSSAYMKKALGYDDASDVVGIHAMGGTWGAFATGLFANLATNPGGSQGIIFGGTAGTLGIQCIGIISSWAWSCGITAIICLIIKYTVGLRAPEEDEVAGMDISQHKEPAYSHE